MWRVEIIWGPVGVAGAENSNECALVGAGPMESVQALSIGHSTMIHNRAACDACVYGDSGYSRLGLLRKALIKV
jgi:hypothetical protein